MMNEFVAEVEGNVLQKRQWKLECVPDAAAEKSSASGPIGASGSAAESYPQQKTDEISAMVDLGVDPSSFVGGNSTNA